MTRILLRIALALLLLAVSCSGLQSNAKSPAAGRLSSLRRAPRNFGPQGSPRDESSYAWVVQTGRDSAPEAVSAILLTFLGQAAAQTGFVADVESSGKVRLADTSHAMEQWSFARWDSAWLHDREANATDANNTAKHPYFPHGAHKVLPGFNLMRKKWPAADWYIMLDDDTFVFRRALIKLLSGLDPQEKLYIGYPRQGAHMCKDPTAAWHEEPEGPFALGGCGMILSRAAVRQLAPNIPRCVGASQDCHLDDVRLFLCLRDIGIRLNTSLHYPAMNFAPDSNVDWARIDPCLQPVAFHGVTPMAMHMLHAADIKHHGQANMAHVLAEMSNWDVHSDRSGIRYCSSHVISNTTDVVDKRDCRLLCEKNADCKGWSYASEDNFCELVNSLTSSQEDWRFSAGISQPAYVCHPGQAAQSA